MNEVLSSTVNASQSYPSQDKETGVELELEDNMPLLEWLANNYKSFGATLEIITDRSQEGSQFVRGFGGVGGMLRLVALCIGIDLRLTF